MKTLWLLMIAIFVVIVATWSAAQGGPPGVRNYDPKTETTVSGTVEDVQQHPGPRSGTGTDLVLKTQQGTTNVYLGPTAFLSQQGFSFTKGDAIEVTGSKVTRNGQEGIIAREVKQSGKTLVLRDQYGKPAWSGPPKV